MDFFIKVLAAWCSEPTEKIAQFLEDFCKWFANES